MPVFISHRTADDELARGVRDRLTSVHGIPCYLDDLDKLLRISTSKGLTSLIVSRLNQCTNLLALVTPNTQGSWWVPFEVGVARQAPRMIATYTSLAQVQLPEYLAEWPVLRGASAIDTFAQYYKQYAPTANRVLLSEKTASAASGNATVETFHQRLRAALNQ